MKLQKYLVFVLRKNEFSSNVQLEAAYYYDLLIKEYSHFFSNSFIDYLEIYLSGFFQEKENEIFFRTYGLMKTYIKKRGFRNLEEIFISLLNKLNIDASLENDQQGILNILNFIPENSNEAIHRSTKVLYFF